MLAWLACHALARAPLPEQWGVPGRVSVIGGQIARLVDDIGVRTDSGGYLLIQSKVGLSLETSPAARRGPLLARGPGLSQLRSG